ncbi:ribosomal protein L13 [Thermoproteus uzoniensis 768-20]|uniref:Large ribosomal subunit protein uL13 n=1 Tax=Thermoproteus uzoniensis (strain 768-20) TaxID=999630 RepID=F2L3Y9_THEU7|nr:50S ribosomal protein L13 [Thermoproteus uzoniensis]AEA13301.1 ribosomal protein L13 [Thermoproteus uzoniensis 768-20]
MSKPLPQRIEKGTIVIDATNHVVGRLASAVAKILRDNRNVNVVVVNIDKALILGSRKMVVNWYMRKISLWRTHYNPEKVGPKIPRRPDRIFKRIVRGMLPYKQKEGRYALKRLRVFMSTPPDLGGELYYIPEALIRPKPLYKAVTLEELWRHIDPKAWNKWKEAQMLSEKIKSTTK